MRELRNLDRIDIDYDCVGSVIFFIKFLEKYLFLKIIMKFGNFEDLKY